MVEEGMDEAGGAFDEVGDDEPGGDGGFKELLGDVLGFYLRVDGFEDGDPGDGEDEGEEQHQVTRGEIHIVQRRRWKRKIQLLKSPKRDILHIPSNQTHNQHPKVTILLQQLMFPAPIRQIIHQR